MIELMVNNGKTAFEPVTVGEAVYESFHRGRAGILAFNILESDYPVSEGSAVSLKVNKKGVFFGIVFTLKKNRDGVISVTAYDQLRYLKSKDVYVYSEKRASDVVKMIAGDYKLKTGTVSKTSYVIPSRVEDNAALFDIIGNALDLEYQYKGGRFTLFDDFGKLTLLGEKEMYTGVVIYADTAGGFRFSSSIDGRFNRVKLESGSIGSGGRSVFIAEDEKSKEEIGILQYYAKIGKKENGGEKSRSLLKLLNRTKRAFSVSKALGDLSVRGGAGVEVRLGGESFTANVKKCVHRFAENSHSMDLELEEI